MTIIPAIDIKNGRCVRLYQGDYEQETVYSENPLEIAISWQKQGAHMLHVVDLDGAKSGKPENFGVVTKITEKLTIPIEVGGGIRDEETIQRYINAGVNRVVLGTTVFQDFSLAEKLFTKFQERIVAALDAKNDQIMISGWTKKSNLFVLETAKKLEELGTQRLMYTDISRDGSLAHPNFPAIQKLIKIVHIPVIASGGVTSLEDILKLKKTGVEGVIIGKALYENKINLKGALNVC